ncbi:MAG TPA: carboxylating nicotinate-nucleotide diphosphorylase [Spirochaetota bacterium]|nr:carboxylating nicotinate-nucleotide diphosphorylase [Spirochaetota bacterium]HPS86211.1 carboxylating nicotinate-nucleotide diphosphorylase [Spirochaetota bacterium]
MENFRNLDSLIEMALNEDLLDIGDVTSEAIFRDELYSYKLMAKESGILCGIDIFIKVMKYVDSKIEVKVHFKDGEAINRGDIIADISGPVVSILKAERTALNFISHLSAIASKTAVFVKRAEGKVVILDTRKTLPGYRELQKYAVSCGGGKNHRMGLYDMVMIKDNHNDAAGGITAAVERVKAKWGDKYKIEVETRNLEEVKEALKCGADRIMLDNLSDADMENAVEFIAGKAETEASGNMNLQRIKSAALTGVDYISFGELTNSVKAFDFSLKEVKDSDRR